MMLSKSLYRSANLVFAALIMWGDQGQAELTIAPVFNRIDGSGPTEDFDLGLTSVTPLKVPGDHFAYVSGDPRAPALDVVHFWNDSPYNITDFYLRIIGTGTDTDDPETIQIDKNVDAHFGDVVDHSIASDNSPIASDIFSNWEITEGGKAIHFYGGSIPPGGRFTSLHYAFSDLVIAPGDVDYAAVDSWFDGALVPEPSSTLLGILGALSFLKFRKQR